MDALRPTDHRLTFRPPAPEGFACCLVCDRILAAEQLGTPCPGVAAVLETEEG
jgi:hypothetical protein